MTINKKCAVCSIGIVHIQDKRAVKHVPGSTVGNTNSASKQWYWVQTWAAFVTIHVTTHH